MKAMTLGPLLLLGIVLLIAATRKPPGPCMPYATECLHCSDCSQCGHCAGKGGKCSVCWDK